MASSQTTSNGSSAANEKGVKGSVEGRVYEKLSLLLLAKNGYELSKDKTKFRDFSIGREISLGRDVKFDDNVFKYTEDDDTKNFIFVQVKHIQRDHQINSRDLSVEAAKAKRGRGGGKSREFNLQKYFISYLTVREELKGATSEEFRNGEIKYVAIFTNAGLDAEELIRKGFSLKEAPDDIIKLFTLKTQEPKDFYQFCNISKDLNEVLMKSSDLHILAREIAQYVVWKTHREKNIMGIDTSPMKHYHVPLAREVFQKSDRVENKSPKKHKKTDQDCEFRDDFLENDEIGSKQELRNAIFEAIRELDGSKNSFSDDELKNLLRGIKWKIVPNFGKTEEKEHINLPPGWKTVEKDDIADFLKSLLLIVNRPRVEDLQDLILRSVQDTMVNRHHNTSLREIVHKLDKTFPELKEHVEQDLGIYETSNFEEGWTSGEEIVKLIDEQKQQISQLFFVTAMTLIYESEIMKFGKFNESEIIEKCLDVFFPSNAKILGVYTSHTLLSSSKILQYLNSKNDYIAEEGRIYTNLDILKRKGNRDSVAKAFELERNVLLLIECRHTVNERDMEEFYNKLYSIVSVKSNKKIILIIPQDKSNNLLEKIKNDLQNKYSLMLENDVIDIKFFEPNEDPFKKEVIIFQGQEKRVSLSDVTGIINWDSYVHSLSQGTSEQGLIDGMTLVEILSNEEIEVGSKPVGTSSLEGAYAHVYEEINVETLVDKLVSQDNDNYENDLYIISGITGSSEAEKTGKLIRYLEPDYENEEFKNRLEKLKDCLKNISVYNLQVFDDQFKDENFQEICHRYPEKRIFWIYPEWKKNATKFLLQEIYNPNFYLKRKFKNVIIKKDLKQYLLKDNLSEIFIFHCSEDKRELYNFMDLNESEIKQFDNSCMIKIFSQKSDAEEDFELSSQKQTVHLLEFEGKELVWCDTRGSSCNLRMYIDQEQSETSFVEEDDLRKKINDRKVVILADDPGMGKSTTLIKLYETENVSSSIIKSHCVIRIQLRDNLKAVRDIDFKKNGIDIGRVVDFLSEIDLKLGNKLAKELMAMALDNNKHFPKSLILAFDGFDEVLDNEDRKKIISLFKFLKDKTAAKIWITSRLQYKQLLENELSNISIEFIPIDDQQKSNYIKMYLQHRLYLTLNEGKYTELFDNNNKNEDHKDILMYIAAFFNKVESIFRDDIARFIGTPLQLYLMLEGSARHFKNWIENDNRKIPVLIYVGYDVFEIYEHFIERKYDVYFQKRGNRESVQEELEKFNIDQYHKDFAVSKIMEVNANNDFEQFKDIFLLVGVIKSQGSYLEFIHKTFEEFFASKVFFHWMRKGTETNKQEYLLTVILMLRDYQLVRTFMNLQLHKMTEKTGQDELNESLKQYGNIAEKLINEENFPFIEETGTTLNIAIAEGNKDIACFLLNSLKGHSVALRKFLFVACRYTKTSHTYKGTALHQACMKGDSEIVKLLLDAAERISKDTLQEFLKCLDEKQDNALNVAIRHTKNHKILKELLSRSNNKIDLLLTPKSALCDACFDENEEGVEFLLQQFKNEEFKHFLKQLLLSKLDVGNALYCASITSTTLVVKLISAAKWMEDNNETLKTMLLPDEGELPLDGAVWFGETNVVETLLNVAKEIDDENLTLKQLLLNERSDGAVLHAAAIRGCGYIIKVLLETAADLGIEMLEKLITAVDAKGKNIIQVMFEHGREGIFAYSFKILEEDKYSNIRNEVLEMFHNVPLESRLCPAMVNLVTAVGSGDSQEVKAILNYAKNSSASPNESLRILLLAEDRWGSNNLSLACERENSEIIKLLLSYAKVIEDDNYTLKQLLLNEITGKSALHVASRWGRVDIIKLLLETASDLGIDFLEKLIFAVDDEGKNAIQYIVEEGHETIFDMSFKVLKDEYPSIWQKVTEVFDYARLEKKHYWDKIKLIQSIEKGDIQEVKVILSNANNSSVSAKERLRILLSSEDWYSNGTIWVAFERGYLEIMKELISYAMNVNDGGETLKHLLTKPVYNETPFRALEHEYILNIKQIVDNLILEARNKIEHAVNVLKELKE